VATVLNGAACAGRTAEGGIENGQRFDRIGGRDVRGGFGVTPDRPGTSPLVDLLARRFASESDHRKIAIELTRTARRLRVMGDARLVDFAMWYAKQQAEYHACTTGDCPHQIQRECSEGMVQQFFTESDKWSEAT